MLTDIQNPYLKYRSRLNKTQGEITEDLKIGDQVLRRVEQGLYGHPTPKYTAYLAQHLNLDPHEIVDEYREWQRSQRRTMRLTIDTAISKWFAGKSHTLKSFVAAVAMETGPDGVGNGSRMTFCKRLRVNPSQMDTVMKRRELPDFIKSALMDAGIEDGTIQSVNEFLAFD